MAGSRGEEGRTRWTAFSTKLCTPRCTLLLSSCTLASMARAGCTPNRCSEWLRWPAADVKSTTPCLGCPNAYRACCAFSGNWGRKNRGSLFFATGEGRNRASVRVLFSRLDCVRRVALRLLHGSADTRLLQYNGLVRFAQALLQHRALALPLPAFPPRAAACRLRLLLLQDLLRYVHVPAHPPTHTLMHTHARAHTHTRQRPESPHHR